MKTLVRFYNEMIWVQRCFDLVTTFGKAPTRKQYK